MSKTARAVLATAAIVPSLIAWLLFDVHPAVALLAGIPATIGWAVIVLLVAIPIGDRWNARRIARSSSEALRHETPEQREWARRIAGSDDPAALEKARKQMFA